MQCFCGNHDSERFIFDTHIVPSNFGMGDRLEAFLRAERMQGSMHRGKSRRHTLQLGQPPSLESNMIELIMSDLGHQLTYLTPLF